MSVFSDVFDWPFTITLVTRTGGDVNKTTGARTLPTEASTSIKGHFVADPATMQTLMGVDPVAIRRTGNMPTREGEARLFTETACPTGSAVTVTFADNSTQRYRVEGIVQQQGLMQKWGVATARTEYRLMREEA